MEQADIFFSSDWIEFIQVWPLVGYVGRQPIWLVTRKRRDHRRFVVDVVDEECCQGRAKVYK